MFIWLFCFASVGNKTLSNRDLPLNEKLAGNATLICSLFIFVSLFNCSQFFKERICFPRSKFFLLRVDPILGVLIDPEITESHISLLHFVKLAEKFGGVLIHCEFKKTFIFAS